MLAGWRSTLPFDPVALETHLKGRWGNQSAASTKREVRGGFVPLSSERLCEEKEKISHRTKQHSKLSYIETKW